MILERRKPFAVTPDQPPGPWKEVAVFSDEGNGVRLTVINLTTAYAFVIRAPSCGRERPRSRFHGNTVDSTGGNTTGATDAARRHSYHALRLRLVANTWILEHVKRPSTRLLCK